MDPDILAVHLKRQFFLRITAKDTTTLMTWANTVANAAPAVPMLNPAQSSRSPAILQTQAMATVNSGVLESPKPRKMQPMRLYATITSMPQPQMRT